MIALSPRYHILKNTTWKAYLRANFRNERSVKNQNSVAQNFDPSNMIYNDILKRIFQKNIEDLRKSIIFCFLNQGGIGIMKLDLIKYSLVLILSKRLTWFFHPYLLMFCLTGMPRMPSHLKFAVRKESRAFNTAISHTSNLLNTCFNVQFL